MSNPMQNLHDIGINPFAVTLLAESMLKSAYVKHCGTKPLTFEFPVRRGDCEGWVGVRITIEAVPTAGGVPEIVVDHTEDMMRMVRRWHSGLETDASLRSYFRAFNPCTYPAVGVPSHSEASDGACNSTVGKERARGSNG